MGAGVHPFLPQIRRVPHRVTQGRTGSTVAQRVVSTSLSVTTTQAPQRYLKTADLRTLIPVGRTSFYALIKQDDFPQPLQLTPGGDYLWEAGEIDAWLASRPRVRFDSPKRRTRAASQPVEDELVLIPVTGRRGAA